MSKPAYIIDLICGIQLVVRIKHSLSKYHYNNTTQYTDDCQAALFTAAASGVSLAHSSGQGTDESWGKPVLGKQGMARVFPEHNHEDNGAHRRAVENL